MTAHFNPLKDTAFELYLDSVDIAAADNGLEEKAKDRRMTEQFKPTFGRVKNDQRRFALAILLDDLRSVFAATAHYAASNVFGAGAYSSFSLLRNDKNNPLSDKAKKIFRKEGVFQRVFDFTAINIRYNPADPTDPLIKKIMNLFCPGFKLGDTWEQNPDNKYGRKIIPISGTTTHYVTLKDLLSVVGKPADDGSSRPAPEPPFAFFNPKYWGPRVRFKFVTDASMSLYISNDVTSGPAVPTYGSPIMITIHPTVEIDFEAEAMAWCLNATDPADITVYDALRHIEPFENMVYRNGGKGMSECRERTTALGATMKTVERINRRIGDSKPRINDEGFAINPDGSVLYLDYKPDIDTFFSGLKEGYNSETGELSLLPQVANIPLILDWSAGVFVWTNANLSSINNTTIKDISETRALKDADIGQMLNAPLGGLFRMALKDALRLAQTIPGAGNLAYGLDADRILAQYQSKEVGVTAANLFSEVYVDKFGNEKPDVTRIFHRIGQLMQLVAENYDNGKDAIATRMTHRFPIMLYGKYADPQYTKRYVDADRETTAQYKRKVDDEARYATPTTFNMPGVSHFMPHQQEITNDYREKDTANVLLGVKAGGGKTVTYTTMVMNDKEAGSAKLPLIVMPKPLLRQFQNEVMNFYSQGAIRVFPIYLAIWKRWESIGLSYQDIEAIIRQQPANTIFLTDYNFLKYRPEEISLGIDGFSSYPVSRWLSRIFDMIVADESHKVKNAGIKGSASAVSRAYGALVTYAQKQVLASGTIVHNTSLDALGQIMKTSPTTFNGDISEYTDSSGKLLKSSKLEEFTQQIAKRNTFYNVSDKRWAFLLPKINEVQHAVNMTPNQQRFYNEKLRELVLMLEESEEYKNAKKKDAESGDTSQQEFLLNQELSGFEIFLGAPDATERSLAGRDPFGAEFRTLATTKPADLISAKVQKVDEIIEAHFNGGFVGDSDIEYVKSKAKIIIFAYNVAIPKHVMQHSRFKNIMLHYEADGEKGLDIIEKFKTDDKYKVLVACEKTLSEGHNLQIASRIIRLQTIWTPGDFDQTLRRVLRPDVPDANGKLKYNRKTIDLDWIITEPSFEVAKTARLFTKFLDKSKFEEYDNNPRFRDWLKKNPYEQLSLFTMNLESIIDLQTFDSLREYQGMYANLKSFEDREYDIEKRDIWKKTILRLKLADKAEIDRISQMPPDAQNDELEKILSSDDLRAKAMVQVEKKTLTGYTPADRADFTRGYTPIVAGATIVDPYKLGLIPVASIVENNKDDNDDLDDENDDETEDAEFNTQVDEGEYVITEFGIGIAGRQRMGRGGEGFSPNIPVTIDGIGKMNLPATIVFVPQDRAQKDRLAGIYKFLTKSRRPTSVLTIDNNSVTVNDITIASSDIPAGKASVKTVSTDRIRDAVEDKIGRVPEKPGLAPAPFTTVKPLPGRRPMPAAPVAPAIARPPITAPVAPAPKPMPGAKPAISVQPPSKPQPIPESKAPKPLPVKTTVAPKPPMVVPPAPAAKPMPGATVKPAAPAPAKTLNAAQKKLLTQPFEVATLNNQLTVIADADNDVFDKAMEDHGFTRIGNSVMAQIINLQGFINIYKYLNDTFYIPDDYQAGLSKALEALKKGKSSVAKLIPSLKEQRQFILTNNKRKVSDINNEIHPIILVDDNIIYLLINVERTRAAKKLTNRMVVKGVSKFTPREAMYLKFYPGVSAMVDDLDKLETQRNITFANERELAKEISRL